MNTAITEEQLKKMMQERGVQITELTFLGRGGPNFLDQGTIVESFTVREHGKKIESLNKEIEEKDGEIIALQKALQEVK